MDFTRPIRLDRLREVLPAELLEHEILPDFSCDMTKSLNQNYWNYCVRTLNKYLSMFAFFHRATMEDFKAPANQAGMYPGESAHEHRAMKRFMAEIFLADQDLGDDPYDAANAALVFYRKVEAAMKAIFNNRLETEEIYNGAIDSLQRFTSSGIIKRAIDANTDVLERAFQIYLDWTAYYLELSLEEAPYGW